MDNPILLEEFVKRVDKTIRGRPFCESTQVGPLTEQTADFVKKRLEEEGYKIERQALINPSMAGETPVYVLYVRR